MIHLPSISGVEFLTSAGWWGFLGLLVPVIIHLLSKKEKNIIQFGSLRFLQAIESDSAKSIQLSQYLLLLCRLVLIGLVCLLLLGPFIKEDVTTKAIWVEESIYNNNNYQQLWNELPEDQEVRLYSHTLSDSIGVLYFKSIWTLINQLNDNADSSVVYSHSLQKNFIGEPVLLDSKVEWKIVPYKTGQRDEAVQKWVSADQEHISINGDNKNEVPAYSKALKLEVIANGYDRELVQLKKVIELSKDNLTYDIEWTTAEADSKDWTIIIGETENQNYKRTILWMPSDRQLEVEAVNNQSLHLTGKIDRENIIDSNLPVRIAAMFNNDMTDIYDYDIRVMNPENLVHLGLVTDTPITDKLALATSNKPLHNYVLLLIIPIFFIERFLNYKSVER